MTGEERSEMKDLILEVLQPLIKEFEASHREHTKDIKVLFKQSSEHYGGVKELEERMNKQVHECQVRAGNSSEKQGVRIEELHTRVVRLEEQNNNKRQTFTQALTIIGLVAMIALQVIYGGV